MFGVFTFSLTHFLAKMIFSRGYGGVQNSSGNSGGVGGYFSGQKLEIPGHSKSIFLVFLRVRLDLFDLRY